MTLPPHSSASDIEYAVEAAGRSLRQADLLALRELLGSDGPLVREMAAQALAYATDMESLPRILELLRDTKPRDGFAFAWAATRLAQTSGTCVAVDTVRAELMAYRRRARGMSRGHADLLLERLPHADGAPRKRADDAGD